MLAQNIWLALPVETRQKLVAYLGIPRSTGTEVVDGKIVCDGHSAEDLQTVTLKKLQDTLGEKEEKDFYKLFNLLVKRLESPTKEAVIKKAKTK